MERTKGGERMICKECGKRNSIRNVLISDATTGDSLFNIGCLCKYCYEKFKKAVINGW